LEKFRDHFTRVAKVNKWVNDNTKAQHLMLALEGNAAEVLKDISDSSPTVVQNIWDALSRRFGEVDEAREALRKFEQRRQTDTESVVEFEQALRSLYRVAWPKVTPEQREVALKTKFEEGLRNSEMQEYLRLLALGDTFSNTVQKAQRFAATLETPKLRKSVRITTPPSHEWVQMIKEDSSWNKRLDKLEDMIESLQVTLQPGSPSPEASSVKCVTRKQSQRQFLTSRFKGETQGRSGPSGQNKPNAKKQFVQPFNDHVDISQGQTRQTVTTSNSANQIRNRPLSGDLEGQNQNLVGAGAPGSNLPQRPPGIPPGVCWVCRQPRCHSRFHESERPPTPPQQFRSPDVCWTCGKPGCRTWYHNAPRPLMSQDLGNERGTRRSGIRDPTQSARTQLN